MQRILVGATLSVAMLVGCTQSEPAAPPPLVPPANQTPAPTAQTQPSEPAKTAAAPLAPPIQPVKPDASASLRDLAAQLLNTSADGSHQINEPAALELEKRGSKAVGDCWPLLSDDRAEVRRGAAFYLLPHFTPTNPQQVAAYRQLLKDTDPVVRGIALQAVRQMQPADAAAVAPDLASLLDVQTEPDEQRRASVVRFLQRLKSSAAAASPAVSRSATEDPSAAVRGAALVALTHIADTVTWLPVAKKSLADNDAGVRLVAAARLRQLGAGAAPAAAELEKCLKDEDERVREAAAEALQKIKASGAGD